MKKWTVCRILFWSVENHSAFLAISQPDLLSTPMFTPFATSLGGLPLCFWQHIKRLWMKGIVLWINHTVDLTKSNIRQYLSTVVFGRDLKLVLNVVVSWNTRLLHLLLWPAGKLDWQLWWTGTLGLCTYCCGELEHWLVYLLLWWVGTLDLMYLLLLGLGTLDWCTYYCGELEH